jgi:outer membrane translocation and assembly module TamA
VVTVEGRRYLGPGPARIFVFTDAGIFDGDRSLGTEGDALKVGAGVGMRVASRLGLVGLDVGAAEDIRSYDEVRLHFSVEGRY